MYMQVCDLQALSGSLLDRFFEQLKVKAMIREGDAGLVFVTV
jgi:hypothetical protein